MLGPLVGSLVSAGASLLGGMRQQDANETAARIANLTQARFNQRQIRLTRAANARSLQEARRQEARSYAFQEKWARKNIQLQKEFAKHGLRWKVRDAKRAGIHPVYALGGTGSTYSPVSVAGGGGSSYSEGVPSLVGPSGGVADASMNNALAAAGQDIGRAISAMQTPQERLADALKVENMGLQNELLKTQIASHVGTGPGLPSWTGPLQQNDPMVIAGHRIIGNPGWSPASVVQNNWGEGSEWLYGLLKVPADIDYTLGQRIPGYYYLNPANVGWRAGSYLRQRFFD